jgi:hypothetical protein
MPALLGQKYATFCIFINLQNKIEFFPKGICIKF